MKKNDIDHFFTDNTEHEKRYINWGSFSVVTFFLCTALITFLAIWVA